MENEKKVRCIVVTVIVILLLLVVGFAIYAVINFKKDDKKLVNVTINQIYSSDYTLNSFANSYFIGAYEDKMINVIIDGEGQEVFKGLEQFEYDAIYKMKDGRYLIYINYDNKFITYIFDGVDVKRFYQIDDVSYVKPILYKGIDDEYIIGFTSMVNDDLYLYNLNSSGILVIESVSLVGDYSTNGVYYTYNEEYLVVRDNDGHMGVINVAGDVVIDYKYKDIINTYDNSFIVLNNKNKYGIIDKNSEILIDFKYKVIDYYRDFYLIVNNDNKMALYNNKYEKLTNFSMNYDTLIEYNLRNEANSINLYKIDGKVAVLNNYLEDKNGIEYDKHNLYIINNGKITNQISQVGFGNEDVLYTYDKDYNVSIYDINFQLLFNFKLENVKKIKNISYISSTVIEVIYIDKNGEDISIYYDLNGKEIDFGLGELVIKNIDYYGYLKNEGDKQKITLYDLEGNYLDDIVGNEIIINGEFLIVDNSIYKIELKS